METIKKFMTRVQSASIGRSKDVRLSMEEASALAAEIGILLTERSSPPKSLTQAEALDIIIAVDGGRL